MSAFTNLQRTIFDSTSNTTMATKKEASKKKSTQKFVGVVKHFFFQTKEVFNDPTAKIFFGVMLLFMSAFIFFAENLNLYDVISDDRFIMAKISSKKLKAIFNYSSHFKYIDLIYRRVFK